MIFVDSNIPMYLVGATHPNKTEAKLMLERAITDGERLVTDAEVLQEILHRYVAIKRRKAIEPAMRAILGVVDEVFPIGHRDVLLAQRILEDDEKLDARDAIHVAVIRRQRVSRVMTFDKRLEAAVG